MDLPAIADFFPDFRRLIQFLASEIESGKISDWENFQKHVLRFFTPAKMQYFESKLPGWERMASYQNGITLIHETAALTALCMREEYQLATKTNQVLLEWIVLFHDISKIARRGWRDQTHALRSAAMAGLQLPHLGFTLKDNNPNTLHYWADLTNHAIISDFHTGEPLPNKQDYPTILAGINRIFGIDTPAALIVKGVLFHMAIYTVKEYPPPNPMTDHEIRICMSSELLSLVRTMMLVDNDAWGLFDPETRQHHNQQTIRVFDRLQRIINR